MAAIRRSAALPALALLLASACSGDGKPAAEGGWAGTMETRADGAVVVRNPAQGAWAAGEEWTVEEDLRIGTAEGEGPALFGRVQAVEVDAMGRIWVLEHNAKELRVFDARGRYVRTIGREGAGPGEFRDPIGLAWAPDSTLWVTDPGNARFTVLDTAGVYLDDHPRRVGGYAMPWRGGFGADALLYEVAVASRGSGRPGLALLRFDGAMEPADTLMLAAHEGQQFDLLHPGGGMSVGVPFTSDLVAAFDPRGAIWSGVNDRYRLVQQRMGGDTARIVERDAPPVPVTAAERDEAIAGLKWFTDQGGRVDPGRIPARKPAFGQVIVAPDSTLWVRPALPAGEQGAAFDVFDAEGRYQGRVRIPGGLDTYPPPVIRRDALYGVARDSMDVQYVVRARIRRGPAAPR